MGGQVYKSSALELSEADAILTVGDPRSSGAQYLVPGVIGLATRGPVLGLEWKWEGERWQSPGGLEQFIRLADGPPGRILAFAQKWGVLDDDGSFVVELSAHYTRPDPDPEMQWLPLDLWRRFAGEAWAMLSVAADILGGKLGRREDWDAMYLMHQDKDPVGRPGQVLELGGQLLSIERWEPGRGPSDHREARIWMGMWVDDWFKRGHLSPSAYWSWDRDGLQVRLDAPGLFGALAVQLAAALSSPLGVRRCYFCGNPFNPKKRRPRFDRRCYCEDCSGGASLAAKRVYWREKYSAAARAGAASGKESQDGQAG